MISCADSLRQKSCPQLSAGWQNFSATAETGGTRWQDPSLMTSRCTWWSVCMTWTWRTFSNVTKSVTSPCVRKFAIADNMHCDSHCSGRFVDVPVIVSRPDSCIVRMSTSGVAQSVYSSTPTRHLLGRSQLLARWPGTRPLFIRAPMSSTGCFRRLYLERRPTCSHPVH